MAYQSRRSGLAMTFIIRAASATVRVIGPTWASVPKGLSGEAGTRPKLGFSPKMPVKPAGMRMEPPPSVPRWSAPMPQAAATAAPPLEPPGVLLWSHGLRVMPVSGELVTPFQPNSGVVVLPRKHRTLLAQPRDGGRVLVPGLVPIDGLGAAQSRPALGEQQILDRCRARHRRAPAAAPWPSALPRLWRMPARPLRRPGKKR